MECFIFNWTRNADLLHNKQIRPYHRKIRKLHIRLGVSMFIKKIAMGMKCMHLNFSFKIWLSLFYVLKIEPNGAGKSIQYIDDDHDHHFL